MASLLDKAVTREGGSWGFVCPVTDGSCGSDGIGFRSTGWPTKEIAADRLDQHVSEHRTGHVAMSLDDFRAKWGLTPTADGQRAVVTAKDL